MRVVLAILACLAGPATLAEEEGKQPPAVAVGHKAVHPGPQPSVTIRSLPAPPASMKPLAAVARGAHSRVVMRRQLRAQIRAMRKELAALNRRIGKAKNETQRRVLEAQAKWLRRHIAWLHRQLRKLKARPLKNLR